MRPMANETALIEADVTEELPTPARFALSKPEQPEAQQRNLPVPLP